MSNDPYCVNPHMEKLLKKLDKAIELLDSGEYSPEYIEYETYGIEAKDYEKARVLLGQVRKAIDKMLDEQTANNT